MPVTLTIDGVPFEYPVVGDEDWGQSATAWATAITNLNAQFTGATAPLADTGVILLGNLDEIAWRNFADDANVRIYVAADDRLYYKNAANPAIDLTSLANGNVTGPLTSTDEAIVRFNGTLGQTVQNSTAILSDTGALSGISTLAMNGTLTGVTSLTMNGALSGVTTLGMNGALSGATDISMTGDLTGADDVSCADLIVSATADLVALDASGAIVFSGTSGHSVSEEFANEVWEEYARPTGSTVGVRGVAVSSASGTVSSTNAAATDITNLTVTITTTGRPVVLELIDDVATGVGLAEISCTSNADGEKFLRYIMHFVRDSSTISSLQFAQNSRVDNGDLFALQIPASSFRHVDVVAAGTYTYKMQHSMSNTGSFSVGPTKTALNMILVAYEL